MTEQITIVEVGPRDGLQNESAIISADTKIELISRLVDAGITAAEITSFVRRDVIPQLSDGDTVAQGAAGLVGLRSIALAPNVRGLDNAIAAGIDEVAVFGAASETFSQRNINCSVAESVERFRAVAERAVEQGVKVRGYVSTVMGCPYEGDVAVGAVVDLVETMFDMGCHEVSVADTIGVGTPRRVAELFRVLSASVPVAQLAWHGHDTYGTGLANAFAAVDVGVRTIDASVGGLGGCPFAGPKARGNLATEDLVYALGSDATSVDLDRLVEIAWWICRELGREPASSVARAMR